MPEAPSIWRAEPFRIFFPLGVLFAWIGVGHWLMYTTGVSSTYSCKIHGLIQMQAFMLAFAVGFLLTAVPRRTQTPPVSAVEMLALAAALIVSTAGALAEQWIVSEIAYAGVFALLAQFALRRFIGRAVVRRPPAAFVMVPIAALHGIIGAVLVALAEFQNAPPGAGHLGMLFIEQGVFLSLAVGIGGLVLPLMSGTPPPPDLGSSPRESWKAAILRCRRSGDLSQFDTRAVWLPTRRADPSRAGRRDRPGTRRRRMATAGKDWRPS